MYYTTLGERIQYANSFDDADICQFYLWIIKNLDMAKIAERLRGPNIKFVLFQYHKYERLPSGKLISEMFERSGKNIIQSIFGPKMTSYSRRKPIYVGHGRTALSKNVYQVVLTNTDNMDRYVRDDDTFSVNL
jgi:hypothetical protein